MSNERVWTYVIGKNLNNEELNSIDQDCKTFVNSWTAHEQKLKASFEILKKQILVIKVDESLYNASGCSIDKLTHFVQDLERKYSTDLLNRMLVAYEHNNEIKVVHSAKIKDMIASGAISDSTLIYDTTISFSQDLINFKKPLKNTWLNKYLPSFTS